MITASAIGAASTGRVIMFHGIRIASFLAVVFATLALAPAAFAGGGVTPDNRADRVGPAGLAGPQAVGGADTVGLGLLHASMVTAHVPAQSAPTSGSDSGFDWFAAAIGAASAFAVSLAAVGIGAGLRNRGRELAA